MASRTRPQEGSNLFDDLPLRPEEPLPQVSVPRPPSVESGKIDAEEIVESLPLFDEEAPDEDEEPNSTAETIDVSTRPAWRPNVPRAAQFSAGITDLLVILAVGTGLWLGIRMLGVSTDMAAIGLIGLFLVPFSYLYQVFPLAFWGRTPGMARAGLVAKGRDGGSLTFSQASLRWVASLVTVCLAGLPWIVTAVTGRSLADRFSDSQTLPAR